MECTSLLKPSQTIGLCSAVETTQFGAPRQPFLSSGETHPLPLLYPFPITNRQYARWQEGGWPVLTHSAPFLRISNRFQSNKLRPFMVLIVGTSLSLDSLSLLFSALDANHIKLRYLELDCIAFAARQCIANPSLQGDLSPLASFPSPLQSLSELCLDGASPALLSHAADSIQSSSLHTLLTLLETSSLSQLTSLHLRGSFVSYV